MDKYEYKVRSQEIRDLIAQGEYSAAVEIADTIDWRRVKSVMMLCTISDLYKINRRLEEAKELLLLAYDRHPGGRTIVYSLCELSIKMGEFVQAIEYYKEFVQIAPKDTGRYVLQYKLYVAQEVSLEERIEVLEELKKREYREKWAYELAYLYHRVGLATRCVEECDELILWFGEGKYVTKAMELKMLHQPLTEEQQARYEGRFDEYRMKQEAAQNPGAIPVDEDNPMDIMSAPTVEISSGEIEDIQVKTMDVGEYNTINLQKELADSLKELWEGAPRNQVAEQQLSVSTEEFFSSETGELNVSEENTGETIAEESDLEATRVFQIPSEMLAEQTEEAEEVMESESVDLTSTQKITQAIVAPLFQQTEDMTEIALPMEEDEPVKEELQEELVVKVDDAEATVDSTAAQVMAEMKTEVVSTHELKRPEVFDKFIGMEYDGQMSFVVPETEHVEKQITGQLNIEDILAEWERMKKENEEKQAEEVRQRVLEHTGNILIDFDQAAKDGLLEKLESSDDVDIPELAGVESSTDVDEEENAETSEELMETMDADEAYGESEELEEIEEVDSSESDEVEEELIEEADSDEEYEEAEEQEEFEIDEADGVEEQEELEIDEEAGGVEEPGESEVAEEEAVEQETGLEEVSETVESEVELEKVTENKEEAEEVVETETETAPIPREEVVVDAPKVRDLTNEEKELYGSFIQNRKSKEQLVNAIDSISLAPYTGNIVITGEEGMDTLTLAKNLMREVQMTDNNFSGKVAKISGSALNTRDIDNVIDKLNNGALIIENAGKMKPETGELLHKALQQENRGIVVIMEGGKKSIGKLFDAVPALNDTFNARINIEALDNDSLVAFGKKYAKEQEYSIDEMGLLALHTCISDRQTSDHAVTILEVKEIVDNAIDHANRKTLGHFFDILFAKRYDEEDMIVLRENDFI